MFNCKGSPGFKFRPRLKTWTDGQNNVFNPATIEARSYGHWAYVRKIRGVVVFNAYRYSMQTSRHQDHARELLKRLKIKIGLVIRTHASLDSFETKALSEFYYELYQLQIETARAGSRPDTNAARVKRIKAIEKDIKRARKLGAKCTRDDMADIKTRLVAREVERVNAMREQRAIDRKISQQSRELLVNSLAA